MEEKIIRISVRNLVEFILREGDIDNRKRGCRIKRLCSLVEEFTGRFKDRWDLTIMRRFR